ncbi:MAG: hypothetical protein ACSLFQ_01570 [Thermoanaerobaculia bacterium]
MRSFTSLVLAITLLGATPLHAEDKVSDVVSRVLAAYGGLAPWRSVDAIAERGVLVSTMRGSAPLFRSFRFPSTLRVEVDYAGATELRMLADGRGWRDGAEVTGPQLDAMVLQAARMALPRVLAEPGVSVKDHGMVDSAGTKLRELEATLPGGLILLVQIEPATNHVVRSIGRTSTAQGGPKLEFVTDYSDFRTVDGLLFAFQEVNYAQGMKTGDTKLDKIHVERLPNDSAAKAGAKI